MVFTCHGCWKMPWQFRSIVLWGGATLIPSLVHSQVPFLPVHTASCLPWFVADICCADICWSIPYNSCIFSDQNYLAEMFADERDKIISNPCFFHVFRWSKAIFPLPVSEMPLPVGAMPIISRPHKAAGQTWQVIGFRSRTCAELPMGYPNMDGFKMEHPNRKWMMTGGSHKALWCETRLKSLVRSPILLLVGGLKATPSWKILVNWDDDITPIFLGKCHIDGNQTTNQPITFRTSPWFSSPLRSTCIWMAVGLRANSSRCWRRWWFFGSRDFGLQQKLKIS